MFPDKHIKHVRPERLLLARRLHESSLIQLDTFLDNKELTALAKIAFSPEKESDSEKIKKFGETDFKHS